MMHKSRTSLFAILLVGAMGLVFLVTSSAYAAAPAGTISYWKLDETMPDVPGDAGTYTDSVGTNDGVSTGVSPLLSPTPSDPAVADSALVGGAQVFDGADTGIDVSDPLDGSFDFTLDESFTIECWMNSTTSIALGDPNQVLVGRDDSPMQWWLGLQGDTVAGANPGNASFYLSDTNGVFQVLRTTVPAPVLLNDGAWHHIVGVYDVTNDAMRLYVDGVEVVAVTPTGFTGTFEAGAGGAEINLGWIDIGGGFPYEGTLDEVAFYSRALTPAEIEDHYDNGLAGHGVDYVAPTVTPTGGGGGGGGGCFISTIAE